MTFQTNDLSDVPFYTPFVHFTKIEGIDNVEAIVKVKNGETLQNVVKIPAADTLLVVVNIDGVATSEDGHIVYSTTPIPSFTDPESRVIVLVVHGDPQEGGTAIVRYRDIP